MKKRIFSLTIAALIALMSISLAGCGTKDNPDDANKTAAKMEITPLETNVECLNQLDLGMVDSVFLDSVVAEYELASSNTADKFKLLPDGESEEYVIGFRKADQTLRDKVQEILCEMKADGTLGKISTQWFGSDITTVAEKPTTVKSDATDESLQKVLDAGVLILGLDATFKPMGFTDGDNQIVGFDIDIAEELCKRMGVKLVKKGIDWKTKEKTLDANVIDCIWNGMSYSGERAAAMCLSESYMNNQMVFVVPTDSTAKSKNDLAGKKVAVQTGSTAQEILDEYNK